MILDKEHVFSDAQALTSSGDGTNIIDLGSDRNIGMGEPMCIVFQLDVAADDADGNETYDIDIETDDNDSFSSPTDIGQTSFTRGDAAGTRKVVPLPPNTDLERYLNIEYTLGGTSPSMTVTAFLIPQSFLQNDFRYPKGYTIS